MSVFILKNKLPWIIPWDSLTEEYIRDESLDAPLRVAPFSPWYELYGLRVLKSVQVDALPRR